MKKIISLLLVSVLVLLTFCLTGCSSSNDNVAILWSGEDTATVPGSLIDCMERSMYTENISYKHYGAKGDAAAQLEQAKTVLNDGCAVLIVELVSNTYAQEIVDAAKEKTVPVVFFNCNVSDEVINSYDKCVLVVPDENTINSVQGLLIADYVKANFKDIDKNEDNKITVINCGFSAEDVAEIIAKVNEILATDDYKVSRDFLGFTNKFNMSVELSDSTFDADSVADYEMLLAIDDTTAYELLVELQKQDYNTDKLKEKFVPIITVGDKFDYKALVLNGRPENPDDYKAYYEANKFLVDLTAAKEEDLDAMIYTTINVIDSGRISGTVIVDNDSVTAAVAKIVKNFISGEDFFQVVSGKVKVSFKSYISG